MDGKDLIRRLNQLLNEESDSKWVDKHSSYDYLYEAALEFVDRTNCLTTTQSTTTTADTSEYDIEPNYFKLYLKNKQGNYYLKYNDGTSDHFLTWKDYEEIIYNNNTDSVSVPSHFCIIDNTLASRLTGTATSTGSLSGGESTLTDTSATFTNAAVGDIIHNTTDSSDGIIIEETSTTALNTALFGGTNNYWTSGDAYVIQPGARYKLVFDQPTSTASHTVTLYYVQRPSPVYSDYFSYRFPAQYTQALVKYAFWLYKYRDSDPNFGDAMYRFWDSQVRKYSYSINRGRRPINMGVNLRKRR